MGIVPKFTVEYEVRTDSDSYLSSEIFRKFFTVEEKMINFLGELKNRDDVIKISIK